MGVNQIFNTSDSDEYSEETSDIDDTIPWIDWFISIDENEVFVEVDSDYIRDTFNLTGLRNSVKHFDRALRIILDLANHFDESHDDRDKSGSDSSVYQASSAMEEVENLYGLIHARYILMHKGMEIMREKYKGKVFGTCPNISCAKQPVLPIGLSNKLGVSNAKVFCPCCNEIYVPSIPRLGTVDGAFFGTSFAHLFFLYYPDLVVTPRETYYVPKLFGFKVWPGVRDALRERFVLPEENKIVEKRKKENSSQVPASVMDDVRSL